MGFVSPRFGNFNSKFMLTKTFSVCIPGDDDQGKLDLHFSVAHDGVVSLDIHIEDELCFEGIVLPGEMGELHEAVGLAGEVANDIMEGGSHE